ncbi:MAG: methionyl-tRNA formyltransferase [Candidatus Saccharibacteria bacterium]
MKKTLKTIIFFGSGPVAAKSLDFLSKNFSIEAVITKYVPPHHKSPAPVETLARSLQLPTYFANTKSELDDIAIKHNFNSKLGIIIDYGVIVSRKVIDIFELGIINSHFSLLPEWRGADPITFSILSGQKKTGVSLMVIEPDLDTGKLIARKSLIIDNEETTPSLTDKLINLSNQMLIDYVPKYEEGLIKPKNQPHPDRATYSRKITKNDGHIDWDKKTAEQIEREIRAYIEWPRSYASLLNNKIIITKAHIANEIKNKLDITCADNKILSIDELIAPSGKKMGSNSFLNGYRA